MPVPGLELELELVPGHGHEPDACAYVAVGAPATWPIQAGVVVPPGAIVRGCRCSVHVIDIPYLTKLGCGTGCTVPESLPATSCCWRLRHPCCPYPSGQKRQLQKDPCHRYYLRCSRPWELGCPSR